MWKTEYEMSTEIKKKSVGRPTETESLKGRHFFLTVPHFGGPIDSVVEALKVHQKEWEFIRWAAVEQTHTKDVNKGTHLHLYVGFPRQCWVKIDRFDYLGKHGKLQRVRDYSAVLKYMTKENKPRANFDYMQDVMRKDFPRAVEILLSQGWHIRDIYRTYSSIVASKNWSGYLRYLTYQKDSEKFSIQLKKPGLRLITPELIRARLTSKEHEEFYANPCFMRIVDLINDIVRYGCTRPHKAKALFITGAPNTGKTTLGLALQKKVGTFTFPDDGWWQGYESDVFKLIMWNEFDLRRFAYPTLLKFLEGLRMDLPIKGSHVTRSDNPLIFLTSNLTLQQLICRRFSSQQNREKSRANLAVRIENIDVGKTPIFMLVKLLVSPLQDVWEDSSSPAPHHPEGPV